MPQIIQAICIIPIKHFKFFVVYKFEIFQAPLKSFENKVSPNQLVYSNIKDYYTNKFVYINEYKNEYNVKPTDLYQTKLYFTQDKFEHHFKILE